MGESYRTACERGLSRGPGSGRNLSAAHDERIKELNESSWGSELRRGELLAQIEEARSTGALVAREAVKAEDALRALVPTLPPPLVEELKSLLQRLPADFANTGLPAAQRLQTIAVALAQIEKFNGAFSAVSEIREVGSGSVEVKTLYPGLGAAFFAQARGGAGGPGETEHFIHGPGNA